MKKSLSMRSDKHITSIAIGKFDGMHLAHQELFKHLDSNGALLCIETKGVCLTPNRAKYCNIPIISIAFSEICELSGDKFMAMLLEHFPNLGRIVVGYDFCFGKDRAFNASDVKRFFDKEVIIVPQKLIDGIGVHSSLIKELIVCGDVSVANAMLGRFYSIEGEVIKGQNLGSKALYATINITTHNYVIPQEGVYASFSKVGNSIYKSVSFVGHRLSTDRAFSIETHLLDVSAVESTTMASICFVKKIRDNAHFSDLALLKQRIAQDIAESRQILESANMDLVLM